MIHTGTGSPRSASKARESSSGDMTCSVFVSDHRLSAPWNRIRVPSVTTRKERPIRQREQDRRADRQAEVVEERAERDAGERQHRAEREVETAGDHHEREPDRDDPENGGAGQQRVDVPAGEEALLREREEDEQGDEQQQHRHEALRGCRGPGPPDGRATERSTQAGLKLARLHQSCPIA
jgi:hypothetical protein